MYQYLQFYESFADIICFYWSSKAGCLHNDEFHLITKYRIVKYAVEWAIILSQHARANSYKHRTKRSYKNYEILINRRVGRECLIYAMYHCIFDKDYRSYVFSSLKVITSNNRKEKKIVRAVSHKRSLRRYFP